MATVRESLLPVFNTVRTLLDTTLGLRQSRVYVRRSTWDGEETYLGSVTTADTEITPRPKVAEEVGGILIVTGITPYHTTAGYTPLDLVPTAGAALDWYYVVQGPDGNLRPYALRSRNVRKNFKYTLVLEPLTRVRPDLEVY